MLKRLSDRTELGIVLILGYGGFVGSQLAALYWLGFTRRVQLSDAALLQVVGYEIVIGAVLLAFLRARGRRSPRLDVSWSSTAEGAFLFAAATMASWVTYAVAVSVSEGPASMRVAGEVSVLVALLLSTVNPVFEESLHLAYLQERLRSHGPGFAIGASLMARLLLHVYQGPMAVVSIVPVGVVFSAFYWRFGRLWPAVVAHAILDAIGLLTLPADVGP